MRVLGFVVAALAGAFVLAACDDEGSDVRHVAIAISDAGCSPTSIEVKSGQQLQLEAKNDSAQLYRITDDDERIEPLAVEPGEEEQVYYLVPEGAGSYSLRCTSADGAETAIVLDAGSTATPFPTKAGGDGSSGTEPAGAPDATLAVTLVEYSVTPSETQIAPGRISVIATNISQAMAHELNVLQLQPDGSFENLGGIDPIDPQEGGSFIVNLQPGTYRLACLIGIGESGSRVDHYQQGMWAEISVQ